MMSATSTTRVLRGNWPRCGHDRPRFERWFVDSPPRREVEVSSVSFVDRKAERTKPIVAATSSGVSVCTDTLNKFRQGTGSVRDDAVIDEYGFNSTRILIETCDHDKTTRATVFFVVVLGQ